MQSVQDFIQQYYIDHQDHLDQSYPGITPIRLLFEFSQYLKIRKDEVYLEQGHKFFKNLEQGVPLEYIQRNAYFYRSNFYVDERVLVPRSPIGELIQAEFQPWLVVTPVMVQALRKILRLIPVAPVTAWAKCACSKAFLPCSKLAHTAKVRAKLLPTHAALAVAKV